ncbi:MAG: hypothetical protein N2C14_27785 [Planctomycetales bacterium]
MNEAGETAEEPIRRREDATDSPRARLAESPWLWFGVFAVTACFGVFAMYPKYSHRRRGLQRRRFAHEEMWRRSVKASEERQQQSPAAAAPVANLADGPIPWMVILGVLSVLPPVLITAFILRRQRLAADRERLKT